MTTTIKTVFFDIGDTLVSGKAWLPGAKELIARLKQKGIRVGLISNIGDWSREQLETEYLPADFDFGWFAEEIVLLSSEVGVEKPSLSIFTMAVSHANCSPWEVLFVAETITETFAAQAAGMRAIRVCNAGEDLAKIGELLTG